MTMIKRALLLVLLLLGLAFAYLALAPAKIDPVAWDPGPVPAMTGALAPNNALAAAELIAQGQIDKLAIRTRYLDYKYGEGVET